MQVKAPRQNGPIVSLDRSAGSRSRDTINQGNGGRHIGWIVRGLLIAAVIVTGWFVARDAAIFGIAQVMVAILLLTAVVAILAFWPSQWTTGISRFRKLR
jgi:hypothetical protein